MSATWICVCGHNFTDYGAVSGDVICCPKCGVILGEALPTQFEAPTTFQVEPPHVALASPEVAVQATEPLVKISRQHRTDDLGEPDIRLKTDRSWIVVVLVVFFACGLGVLAFGLFFCRPMVDDHRDTAQIQVKALANVCDAYKVKHGKCPEMLLTLMQRDEFGTIWLDDPGNLIDPWGRPYQYDPKGGRNDGRHPDIWVVTPDGMTIGNWPRKIK